MPTHGDFPWERDARKRRQDGVRMDPSAPLRNTARPKTRPTARRQTGHVATAVLALTIAFVAIVLRGGDLPSLTDLRDAAAGPPAAPAAVVPPPRVVTLESRFLSRRTVEIWGSATAADGTTVRLSVRVGGRRRKLVDVPAVAGRFYARETLPTRLRGQRLRLVARLAP